MLRRQFLLRSAALATAPLTYAWAQQARYFRVGVLFSGGNYSAAVDGFRDGLKKLGLEEGKQVLLHERNVRGDMNAVAAAASRLEQEKVDLIFSVSSSVTIRAKKATNAVPIVFYAGTDPVSTGLVASFAKPGGRLTGIYSRNNDLVPKRFQLLKELVPKIQRAVAFYNANNPIAVRSMEEARQVAERLKIELVGRSVTTTEELRQGLHALRPGDADAFFQLTDSFLISNAQLIIDAAREKKLPTIFADREAVSKGALVAYGASYASMGREAAIYAQRVLQGKSPADLSVEQVDVFRLSVNLKTARSIGLTIPDSLLARADEVVR